MDWKEVDRDGNGFIYESVLGNLALRVVKSSYAVTWAVVRIDLFQVLAYEYADSVDIAKQAAIDFVKYNNLINTTDVEIRIAKIEGQTVAIVSGVSISTLESNPEVYNHVNAMIGSLLNHDAIEVKHCARCGKDHAVTFRKLQGDPVHTEGQDYMYSGICPNTGDPILMRYATFETRTGELDTL